MSNKAAYYKKKAQEEGFEGSGKKLPEQPAIHWSEELLPLESRPKKVVGIDIETTGLSWKSRVLTVGLAARELGEHTNLPMFERPGSGRTEDVEGKLWTTKTVLNIGKRDLFHDCDPIPEARQVVQKYIEGADWVVFHGASFDIPYLHKLGLLSTEQIKYRTFDTLGMARCTGSHSSVALADLVSEYKIPHPNWLNSMKSKRSKMEKVDTQSLLEYNGEDGRINLDLFDIIFGLAIAQYDRQFIVDESRYVNLVSMMRVHGIPVDVSRLKENRIRIMQELQKYHQVIFGFGIKGITAASIGSFLRSHGLDLPITDKGNDKSDEPVLLDLPGVREYRRLKYEDWEPEDVEKNRIRMTELEKYRGGTPKFIDAVLQIRGLDKELSTWVVGFEEEMDDRNIVHPLWSVSGTVSYRLTCTEPAAQAVPKHMRMWKSEDDDRALVEADYQQAELRFGAAMAGEDSMAVAFFNGVDIHLATAIVMYGEKDGPPRRGIGKRANFTGFYGGGAPALALALGIPEDEARVIVNDWRGGYKNVWSTAKRAEKVWGERGYLILAHGKRLWASPEDVQFRIYKAYNQLIQGSIAEIIKKAMLDIDVALPDIRQVGQIHDNLMTTMPLESHEACMPRIVEIMMDAAPANVLRNTDPNIEMLVDISRTYPKEITLEKSAYTVY